MKEIRIRDHQFLRDNRRNPRFPLKVDVNLDSVEVENGEAQDIGRGGLYVATRRLLRVGERLRVRLTLPGIGLPLEPLCEVRWLRDADRARRDLQAMGMGLEFVGLSPLLREAIHTYVTRQESFRPGRYE